VKLAATRRVLAELGSRDPAGEALLGEDIRSIEQLMAAARAEGPETEQRAKAALASFSPLLLLNQAGGDRAALARIGNVIRKFLGSDAEVLGQVPVDPAVVTSVRKFLPVVEAAPDAPAARAYVQVERALRERLARVTTASEKTER
jgi:MinD-like ATPase involved in chromosome partitioning or flagellar assembly